MKSQKLQLIIAILLLSCLKLAAQSSREMIKVIIAPDHIDWTYKLGEKVKFTVSVLQNSNLIKNTKIVYQIGLEKMEPAMIDSVILSSGIIELDGGTLTDPGFLRCIVTTEFNGVKYRNLATVGFNPAEIKPTVQQPVDFQKFWEDAKFELSKIPIDARMILLPNKCTETVNVFQVNLQNYGNSRLYGILCVPKKEGKYPALLEVPGAGVRAYLGNVELAEKGIITFSIGIHGIPVTMDAGVYSDIATSALKGYFNYNLDNKDRYYYKRVYLGCIRANDFLAGLPEFDGSNLAVWGGSQGGALSIVTAALDSRIKCLAAFFPALCDETGYLHGRAGGWPHLFDKANLPYNNTKEKLETINYYDVVNFARIVKTDGLYSWGFNDETCPPTSMYAAYNVISAPKSLILELETGHWTYPEQWDTATNWMLNKLKGISGVHGSSFLPKNGQMEKTKKVKVAMIQMNVQGNDITANLATANRMVKQAKSNGSDIALLPECMDIGWTHPASLINATSVPDGEVFRKLSAMAKKYNIYICSGMTERDMDKIYNTAVLINNKGQLLLKYHKINELDIGKPYYGTGDRINVVDTQLGRIGMMICADATVSDGSIPSALARMEPNLILSPCAWAVPPEYDNAKEHYGSNWRKAYQPIAENFSTYIIAVSNVGKIIDGPWKGWDCIGASLAFDNKGKEILQCPFGVAAETIKYIDCTF